MKQLAFQTLVPACTIQDFYQIALGDEQAISKFHRQVNKDETVRVSPWSSTSSSGDGGAVTPGQQQQALQRTVEFILAMSIPKSVQSFIGAGPVRIKELQTVTWLDDVTLEIVSEPEVQISYAKSLVTRAELLVRGSDAGVSIDVKVVVTASVPWPMQGTIESLMADQAKKTVGQYVEWIGQYVEEVMEDMNNLRRTQEDAAAHAATEAVAMLPQLQQQQLELLATGPPTPPESTAAAAVAEAPAARPPHAMPAPLTPAAAPAAAVTAVAAAASTTAIVPRQAAAALVAVADADADVFFDASEVVPGGTLDLLLRELREAREARDTTNRLLQSIKESVQHVDYAVARELAFQDGVRHAQLAAGAGAGSSGSTYSWLLSVAATAALASATTSYLLMRRNAL